MRKLFYLLVILFLFLQTEVLGQIFFTVELQPDQVTYLVKLRPEGVSYSTPLNTTNNAQVTFVVPTGGFQAANIKSIKGDWKNGNNVIAPSENPEKDYLVFNLNGNISDLDYVAGEEAELFSFENVGECTGTLEFVKNDDPFYPPNSKNINIGNQISVLGAGFVNAFSGTYGEIANCQESQSGVEECGIVVDTVITQNPSQCGLVGGTITISASIDKDLALLYSIDDGENWQLDSVFTGLVSGKRYVISVRDEVPNCLVEHGFVELGPPSDAIIVNTGSTPDNCNSSDGTITVEAVPISSSVILEYSIDEGQSWQESNGIFSNLAAGTYHPRVRAKDAPCYDEVDEIVVAAECSNGGPDNDCVFTYVLDLENGKFVVSVLSDTTFVFPQNITSTAQITLKVPTGDFQASNFENLIDGVSFAENARTNAPLEAPQYDYISFGLVKPGAEGIFYTKGEKTRLFSFENGGACTGGQVLLIENNIDPFFPPNSENANIGQHLTVLGMDGSGATICINSNSITDCGDLIGPGGFDKDTLFITIPVNETTTICIEDELEIPNGSIGNASLCNDGGTVMTTLTDGSNCADIQTDEHFNQTEIICIVHCEESNANSCDTTILVLCPKVDLGNDLSICTGETIELNPLGGTGNFTWITNGNISCTDCPNPSISPDMDTEYILMSSDGNGCMDRDTFNVSILAVPNISKVAAQPLTNCMNNGVILITAEGGEGNLQYSIDDGTTYQNSTEFTDLGPGTYQVIVTNEDKSCTVSWPEEIALVIAGASVIEGIDPISPNDCTNEKGSILVRATVDSMEVIEYSIDGGNTWQESGLFQDLEQGDYTVVVRIQNSDCEATYQSNPVQLIEQAAIQIMESPGDRTICEEASRTLQLEINENIADFNITGGPFENAEIENGVLTFDTDLASDTSSYTVTLIGESGCTISDQFTLRVGENTDNWEIDIETTPASCENNDGAIGVVVNQNNNGFTFCWEPNKATGPTRTGLSSDSTYNLTITGSSGCSVIRENLSTGTTCEVPSCEIFVGLDTFNAVVADDKVAVCLPVADMDLSEFQYFLNGQLVNMGFGECMQASIFYGYDVLLTLGNAPYLLERWTTNEGALIDIEFQTIEELVTQMNQFDSQTNWVLDEDNKIIQGFSSDNQYGSLNIHHIGSSTTLELQLNNMNTMYQSIIFQGTGVQHYTVKDPINDCEDDLIIKIRGSLSNSDTMDLVTQINTPINDQCLDTDITGTENLEINVCESPETGILSLGPNNCFDYMPGSDFIGEDIFCLELCSGEICDTTIIRVDVNQEGLVFFTGMSPNGDGINDAFTIKNIESFPDNNLIIYNRWGNRIFQKENYANDNGWDGTFNNLNLPDGVYFYLLKVIVNGSEQFFSGPITLSR